MQQLQRIARGLLTKRTSCSVQSSVGDATHRNAQKTDRFPDRICPRDESDESSNGFPKENGPCSAPPATSASPATPPLTPALDPPSSALPGSGSQPCADAPRVPRASVPNFPDQSQSRTSDPAAMVRANSSGSVTRSPASARLETSVKEPSRHENLYPAHHGPYVKGPIYVDYGINVTIGSSTFINRNCHILDAPVASLVIGERCLLGPNVHLYNVTHTLDAGKRTDPSCDSSSLAGDIRIGDDCWIGETHDPGSQCEEDIAHSSSYSCKRPFKFNLSRSDLRSLGISIYFRVQKKFEHKKYYQYPWVVGSHFERAMRNDHFTLEPEH